MVPTFVPNLQWTLGRKSVLQKSGTRVNRSKKNTSSGYFETLDIRYIREFFHSLHLALTHK